MANNTIADKLDMLAGQLSSAAQRLRSGALSLEADTRERLGLITAASDLVNIIGQPKDKLMMFLPMSTHWTSVRLFIKWKAFEKIPTDDGADISYAELAAKVGGDQSLISKISLGAAPLSWDGGFQLTLRSPLRTNACREWDSPPDRNGPRCSHGTLQMLCHGESDLGNGAVLVNLPCPKAQ
jgi:hypothetical protein